MTTTALSVITAAFELGNVFQAGDPIPAADSQAALGWLNRMVSGWAQQASTIPAIARHVFALVSGKAEYSIGIGGDLNIVKPANQNSIVAVGLLLGASTPPVEIPRGLLTDDGWQSVQIKGLTNSLFTDLYYNPTFAATGLGTINLWPIPLDSVNSLVLYVAQALTQFVDLTTVYQVPDGLEEVLIYNLWRRLAKPWGRVLEADDLAMAGSTLRAFKRSNLKLSDLPNDLLFQHARGFYNIDTGQ